MGKTIKFWVIIGVHVCLIFMINLAFAAIPDTFNIHGKLTDPSGSASVGTFEMNFSIYDVASGGSNIYTQSHSIKTDSGGIYTLLLSSLDGVDFEQNTWLEIQVESDSPMSPRINLSSVPSTLAGGGSSLWSAGILGDIYYTSGDVGIGISNPLTTLHLEESSGLTELRIDSGSGVIDSALTFYNDGLKEYDICMDDSASDELKFIRSSNTACSGKDTFTITSSGLEMGTAMFYFDAPTRWWRSPCCSATGNNFFEFDDTTIPIGLTLSTLTGGEQGQRITIICSDTGSVVRDETGNINLAGDFDCGVVGVGSTLELIYFDNAQQTYDWHETSRSVN